MSYLEDAKVLFGDMRNLTKEEQEALYNSLDRISEPTKITLFDVEPRKVVKVKGKVTKIYRANDELETDKNYNYNIECLAMAIVNYTNEINSVPLEVRQENNDECFDFAIEKIREFLEN